MDTHQAALLLQKNAELENELAAKNRELQIEAALEKVRSISFAMHHTDELEKVVTVLSDKLVELALSFDGTLIFYFDKEKRHIYLWIATKYLPAPIRVNLPYEEEIARNQIIKDLWNAVENGEDTINKSYSGKVKDDYFSYVGKHNEPKIPESARALNLQAERWTVTLAAEKNSVICLDSWSGPVTSNEDFQVLKRFARVFEQAYTRFLDLQRAEAQAREAQIQLALERVRARTMAMQKSNELAEVATLLFKQVAELGIKTWTTGFNIWSDDNNAYEDWITDAAGGFIEPYIIDATAFSEFKKLSDAKKSGTAFFVLYQEGETLKEAYKQLSRFADKKQFEKLLTSGFQFPTSQYVHLVFGSKVSLMFITYEPVPEAHDIFKRFGNVFEQTYTRFLDLQKAEAQAVRAQQDLIAIKAARKKAEDTLAALKAAQQQLVQSEKMASLGELTAGIAHEIQNPLNFVNNFSETNQELLEELKQELKNGNLEEVNAIASDVISNEQKISHHGKRADSIVKGMLQHSRSNTGKKEPTAINTLADEYLRLSYHGLRAKDKTFNALMITHFDESIGKVNIVPQEIGRVLLNLFSNAFYAVHEKMKKFMEGYEPTVSVSTEKMADKIAIQVKDNGMGISKSLQDKIFQPFFTTKPTGEGTGLGLSLSYDIIKAHGGELKVESEEGQYTTFIVQLPLV